MFFRIFPITVTSVRYDRCIINLVVVEVKVEEKKKYPGIPVFFIQWVDFSFCLYYKVIDKRRYKMQDTEIFERISSDPDICHGKPCIKGTRIPVYLLVSLVAEGEDTETIIKDYPSITPGDIKAAVRYAARLCEYEAYAI